MTNDLFRDLLEGRQPMARKQYTQAQSMRVMAEVLGVAFEEVAETFRKFGLAIATAFIDSETKPEPPIDPRARALWAKEQQGHGPKGAPLRVRGRTTHYKEKR